MSFWQAVLSSASSPAGAANLSDPFGWHVRPSGLVPALGGPLDAAVATHQAKAHPKALRLGNC